MKKVKRPMLWLDMPDMQAHEKDIKTVQRKLLEKGFNPGAIDGIFGLGTQAAVMAFQRSQELLADGIVGPRTFAALMEKKPAPLPSVMDQITPLVVSRMFPHTPVVNIKRNLPYVCDALVNADLQDRLMVLMALATIRAETESFEPVAEGISRYNTSPDPQGHSFDLYDYRADLGNQGPPDGQAYRGRGYVQLTGRYNYQKYGKIIGQPLLKKPELASEPEIAATLLAQFLADKERLIKEALMDADFRAARRLVNGGTHGLERFTQAYKIGMHLTA